MNDLTRQLLTAICNGNSWQTKMLARRILEGIKSEKDRRMQQALLYRLDRLDSKQELPANVAGLVMVQDTRELNTAAFWTPPYLEEFAQRIAKTSRAASVLAEHGITYPASGILYGATGCGKTTLARLIAAKLERELVLVNFGNVVDSALGSTQKHISAVFNFAKQRRCVLCLDEFDAIALKRGKESDSCGAEMDRATITVMQEIDQLPGDIIVLATTNRFEDIDPAVARRFSHKLEVKPFGAQEATLCATTYNRGYNLNLWPTMEEFHDFCSKHLNRNGITAAEIVKLCNDLFVDKVDKGVPDMPTNENEEPNIFDLVITPEELGE